MAKLTSVGRVQALIYGRWRFPYDVVEEVKGLTGVLMSESACTARIRDCRKRGFTVEKRRAVNGNSWQYRIPRKSR